MKPAWLAVLKAIQLVAPEAILGGGALRDLDNGRPVNDLDIFVDDDHLDAACGVIEMHCLTALLTKTIDDAYLTWDNSVERIRVYEDFGHEPVNLIGLQPGTCTVEQQLNRFDFGICRIVHDGTALHTHPTYHEDKETQTFTLSWRPTPEQRECSLKRFARLSVKYPGWRLIELPEPILSASDFDFGDML